MINYDDANEAVKGCIDDLTYQYVKNMKEYPLSWVECAWNRAMLVKLDELEKRLEECNYEKNHNNNIL